MAPYQRVARGNGATGSVKHEEEPMETHPTVRALFQAILDNAETIERYHAGTIRLRFHRTQVKVSLELQLPNGV